MSRSTVFDEQLAEQTNSDPRLAPARLLAAQALVETHPRYLTQQEFVKSDQDRASLAFHLQAGHDKKVFCRRSAEQGS